MNESFTPLINIVRVQGMTWIEEYSRLMRRLGLHGRSVMAKRQPQTAPQATHRSIDAQATLASFDDGTFVRTAIVVDDMTNGSIDVVDKTGRRVGQINIFHSAGGPFMVDIIDVDDRFAPARAIVFEKTAKGTTRKDIDGGVIVAAHFALKGTKA